MKRLVQVTLGILTAIGGFVDIGDIVANSESGARFGLSLAWVVVVGLIGIVVYAEMAGRVATVSKRPVFDLVRERLGARMALLNLAASSFVNLLTLIAEVAGIALALQLASDVSYLLWVPLTGLLVWLVVWRVGFEAMERVFGLMGLALVVVAVTAWRLHPHWGALYHQASHPHVPKSEKVTTWAYFAIGLFGAAMTPYEVFFFSSGGVEEGWTKTDLSVNRANVFIGFPLGAALSLSLMVTAALVLAPRQISVGNLAQAALPTVLVMGKLGLAVIIVGIFAATFGAALETSLSAGYTVAQYFGWPWGKRLRPDQAPRFHLVTLLTILAAIAIALTSVDPIKVTEYSIVFSAAVLPLTYIPILVIANDPDYMGDKVNGRFVNFLGSIYMVIILAVSAATIPLMIITKAGQ